MAAYRRFSSRRERPSSLDPRGGVQSAAMDRIRVVVSGSGKMGRQVASAVQAERDLELAGFVDGLAASDHVEGLPVFRDAEQGLRAFEPDVVIDFTNAAWTPQVVPAALEHGARLVIGTTGLSGEFLATLERECLARKRGAVVRRISR